MESGRRELEGMEEFPIRVNKSRKRKTNTLTWKRHVSKIRKIRGESYVSSRGKFVPKTSLKDPCPPTCRRKCRNMITNEERLNIFQHYYQLDSYERQRDFIHSNTEKKSKNGSPSKTQNAIILYCTIYPKTTKKFKSAKRYSLALLE